MVIYHMHVIYGLDAWFSEQLTSLHCCYKPETIAYVTSVLKELAHPRSGTDLSDRSIVLAYAAAVQTGEFERFQQIGDWVLWSNIIIPESIAEHKSIIENIGQNSYLSCYRIMHKKWHVYAELADTLPTLSAHVRQKLIV